MMFNWVSLYWYENIAQVFWFFLSMPFCHRCSTVVSADGLSRASY